MAFEWTQTWATADVGHRAVGMTVFGGEIWVSTQEHNPNGWPIRVYHGDGVVFNEDVAVWNDMLNMSILSYGGQLFSHQGLLHIVVNRRNAPGGADMDGQIFRRDPGGWVEVCGEVVDSRYLYYRAYSNGTWIVIGGTNTAPAPDNAVIWSWNGAAKTLEYEGTNDGIAVDTTYYDGIWYANINSALMRYRTNTGAWAIEYNGAIEGERFCDTDIGLMCGDLLRRSSGTWLDTDWPTFTMSPLHQYGQCIIGAYGGTGNTYVYFPSMGWWYAGIIGGPGSTSSYVYDLVTFGDDLYACGQVRVGGGALVPCVWQLDPPDFDLCPPDAGGGGAGGLGLLPQVMDCDGDGDALFLALYDSVAGNPILVRVPLPLTPASLGLTIFDPGVGNAINVKCAAVGGRLAISGLLSAGGNDSVQVSEDSGITFTDIAPAWADMAQPLLVDPDGVDEVAVALDAAQDLYDTEDQGVTWVQRQAAVGYSPGAMARLPDGDELVIGDDVANRIDYSPNKGQNLTNVTGAFAGNVAALEVV